jgi:hypothetical protein
MKQEDRERIFEALMYGIPRDGSAVERELAASVTHDIKLIEPIVDDIIAKATGKSGGVENHDRNNQAVLPLRPEQRRLLDASRRRRRARRALRPRAS